MTDPTPSNEQWRCVAERLDLGFHVCSAARPHYDCIEANGGDVSAVDAECCGDAPSCGAACRNSDGTVWLPPAPSSDTPSELDELRATLAEYDGRTLSEIIAGVDGRAVHAPVIDAVRSLLAAADRGEG